MKKNKVSILHYYPLEYYPPVINLINSVKDNLNINVFTTKNSKNITDFNPKGAKINRFNTVEIKDHFITKIIKYLSFNLLTILKLIRLTPEAIIYYESNSAFPVFIYNLINKKCKIYIHYHEYASKDWYNKYMKIFLFYHKIEKKYIYPKAQWISQTNSDRLNFFYEDHPNLKKEQLKIMPNYPPKSWASNQQKKLKKDTTRLVYIGSLGFDSTYLYELCNWLETQNKFTLDIYSYNLHADVKEYLLKINNPRITFFKNGVPYNEIPQILHNYDVGLILYKPFNENYTYNAPNKLFEYLACNLDVWYPNTLKGPIPYLTTNTYPKVIPINFEQLSNFDANAVLSKENCSYQGSTYFCENVYNQFLKEIHN